MSARPHLQSILETVPDAMGDLRRGRAYPIVQCTAERLLGFTADETHNDTSHPRSAGRIRDAEPSSVRPKAQNISDQICTFITLQDEVWHFAMRGLKHGLQR